MNLSTHLQEKISQLRASWGQDYEFLVAKMDGITQ